MADLSIDEKKEYAKVLYLKENLTQKEIAAKAKVSENTIGKWVKAGKWEELKTTHILTKEEELRRLYVMLKATNDSIEKRDASAIKAGFKDGVPNSKEADTINKIAAAIRQLQTEAGVSEIIDVATEMISHYKTMDFDKAKELTELFNAFIQFKIKAA